MNRDDFESANTKIVRSKTQGRCLTKLYFHFSRRADKREDQADGRTDGRANGRIGRAIESASLVPERPPCHQNIRASSSMKIKQLQVLTLTCSRQISPMISSGNKNGVKWSSPPRTSKSFQSRRTSMNLPAVTSQLQIKP